MKPRTILMRTFTSCVLLFSLTTLSAKPERPKPDILFIDNGVAKVGIDRSMGASITWLSWKGSPGNAINIHDPGRLLQQSYYAGKTLDRQADGQVKAWSPWSWNPIQGGGVNSWARVTDFRRIAQGQLHSTTVPKLWDMPNEEAEAVMEQGTEFVEGMPNVVVVRNRLVCKRAKGDKWGDAVPRSQELPACYFTSRFRNAEMYLGEGKWEAVKQPQGPPWGKAQPPLNIMACFADNGQGIAVFCPASDKHWNFGPHQKYDPAAKPTDNPCMHMAPIGVAKLGPRSILEYSYWLVVGNKAAMEPRLDALLKKHKDEKLKVTEPE